MDINPNKYYHIYNRSNNYETVFKSIENYDYFIRKYRKYLAFHFDTIAYCLMPTHFHFLVFVKDIDRKDKPEDISEIEFIDSIMLYIKKKTGLLLSSYAKAINKRYNRHGSLFKGHTKALEVDDESYLLSLISYIHQNPIRAGLVHSLDEWYFSSYREYIDQDRSDFISKEIVYSYFRTIDEFKKHSEILLDNINEKYWIKI